MGFLAKLFGSRTTKLAPSTGALLTSVDVRAMMGNPCICGDEKYAVVNSAWLSAYYKDYRKVLFDQGVAQWDERFDCNHFASFFVSLASVRFFSAAFHSITPAKTLALGEYWYRPAGGIAGHAIVVAMTERGPVYIEPQTGAEVDLSANEKLTRFLVKF